MSSIRPVVATTSGTTPSIASACSSRGSPPKMAEAATPHGRRSAWHVDNTCCASSRVGTSTSASGPCPQRSGGEAAIACDIAGSR